MEILDNIRWYHTTIAILIIVILLLLFSNYRCATTPAVVNVQRENFNRCGQKQGQVQTVSQQNNGKSEIVFYYTMWCPHCKNLIPEWEKFEQHAKQNLPWLTVTRMKCEDSNEQICKQKGVEGYPTIILYDKTGKANTYEGDRKAEGIINFVSKYN